MFPLVILSAVALASEPASVDVASAGEVRGTLHVAGDGDLFATTSRIDGALVFLEFLPGYHAVPDPAQRIEQAARAFSPTLLVVQKGTQVSFPNRDVVFHNVFSLTAGSEFDLGIYAQGGEKAVRFQRPGIVDVFCNIHPEMAASIVVLQNPYVARASAEGRYSLKLPAGQQNLVAFWPHGQATRQTVNVPAGGVVQLDISLQSRAEVRHLNKYGQPYGRYK